LNAGLRNGKLTDSSHVKLVQNLDQAINKSELPQDLTLFRGASLRSLGLSADSLKSADQLVGKTITDKSYVSTSLTSSTAGEFSHGVLVKIDAHKGAKGIYMNDLDGKHGNEMEMLLPRGSKFRVVKTEVVNLKGKDGVTPTLLLHTELL